MSRNLILAIQGYEMDPREFEVTERLSTTFDVTVIARICDHDVDLKKIVGGKASFGIKTKQKERWWHGLATSAQLLRPEPNGESSYRITLAPALWLTKQVRTHRIFQHEAIPDIVEKVLAPYQIQLSKKLRQDHPKHEYVVQYAETDFNFVSRLLEDAGITFYFEHSRSDSKMVLDDSPDQGAPAGRPLGYVVRPNPESRELWSTSVSVRACVTPGKVTLRDYNFRQPTRWLSAEAQNGVGYEPKLEQYIYAHGSMLVEKGGGGEGVQDDKGKARHHEDYGKKKAERWLHGMRCSSRRVSFATNDVGVAAGLVMKLGEHPHPDAGKDLLINATYFGGTAHGAWVTMVEASLCEDGYAPPPITARPRIPGVQSAVVVGPKGEEIYTDEYGRVRVQFQWDREGKGVSDGEASSTWMRVAQAWAGKRWGMMNIPRIGHEVLVRYYDGNPDHPVVGGRVHNKIQPVPYKLPKHKAKSLWKSDSSPHRDNHYNEIRLDDRKDFELMYVQAQRDRQELVRRHETERTGENRVAVVGGSRSAIVREHDGTLVGKEFSLQMVKKPSLEDMVILAGDDEQIPPQKKPKLQPQPTKIDMMDKKLMTTTGQATLEMDDDEIIFETKGELSFRAKGNVIVEGGSFIKINCSGG